MIKQDITKEAFQEEYEIDVFLKKIHSLKSKGATHINFEISQGERFLFKWLHAYRYRSMDDLRSELDSRG